MISRKKSTIAIIVSTLLVVLLITSFLLNTSDRLSKFNSNIKIVPARLAVLGESVPSIIEAREQPIELKPVRYLPDVVTDEQLVSVLSAACPLWYPPAVPSLMHELLLWGRKADFTEVMIGQAWSGTMMVETLLSDKLCRERTVPLGGSYLIDSPYGINIVKLGTADAMEARGEAHTGQFLKVLAEAQVPLSTPARTESGRIGTVKDILQDGILRFSLDRENEFMAVAIALYLPPAKTWIDQYGVTHSFDELLGKLLDRPLGEGSCGGCHIPYAVVTILRVDEEFHILTSPVRNRALRWLEQVSLRLTKSQRTSGGNWDATWAGDSQPHDLYKDEVMDRICVTGHHLEWMALAPEQLRPRKKVILEAVSALTHDIDRLPERGARSFKTLLPCSHAARAICLLSGRDASTTWKMFWDSKQLTWNKKRGYQFKLREERGVSPSQNVLHQRTRERG